MSATQITDASGEVTITNDGATILKQMQVLHPAAKMVCSLFRYGKTYLYSE
jgi:T-complex protein 1 subunit delta